MNKNNVKTAMLLAGLGGLVILISELLIGGTGGLVIGLGIGFAMAFSSYWFSDKIAVKASGAKPVTREEAPRLYAMMDELTQRANMPMPKLYITPSPQPNAFATGRNPEHSAVAVTQGILDILEEDELKGVLAHELMHVGNRDILISSVAAAVAMGIMLLTRMAFFGALFGGGRDNRDGGGIGALLLLFLAPVAAGVLQMALSRSREFEADHDGAALLGHGEPLARALEKLDAAARQVPMNVNPAQASMYIVNPLTGRKVEFANLFRTHPPTEERVRRLRSQRP